MPPKLLVQQPQPATTPELSSDQAFHEVFWPAYPRKIAKFAAFKAWKSLKLPDDDQETLDKIMKGLDFYLKEEWDLDRPKFIPHGSTWLHQRRWEDCT